MAKVIDVMPELQGEEMIYIQNIINTMDENQARTFAGAYRARRKDPMMILILAIVGFFGIAGIHRFILNDIGMGILYVLTAGLCFIGTIVDIVNYQKLALEANRKVANEVVIMMGS